MSLLTALIVNKSYCFTGIYVIFLEKHPKPSLKDFQDQFWASVKKITKVVIK